MDGLGGCLEQGFAGLPVKFVDVIVALVDVPKSVVSGLQSHLVLDRVKRTWGSGRLSCMPFFLAPLSLGCFNPLVFPLFTQRKRGRVMVVPPWVGMMWVLCCLNPL